ncbi:MAG: hypothetical protein JWO90_549 [Solirubrobacterales bacterium]|jgi:hypothetical protein|nr:hypothetical protein [Solirubrobacterales bacterium]
MSGPAVVALDVGGPSEPWAGIGLEVADEVAQLGDVTLRFGCRGDGLTGWALRAAAGPADLDGLPTLWLPEPTTPSAPKGHGLGVTAVDHVVVQTPDPARTFACFQDAGLVLRLERDAGTPERPLRQGFFRHGQARIEVVGPREVADDGPARFWGLTLTVEDLDAAVAELGPERCRPAKDAVQPGRRIAALRPEAGLPVPVALMSPEAQGV